MPKPKSAPYGSWVSPIQAEDIVRDSIRLGQLMLDNGDLYWSDEATERRHPSEGLQHSSVVAGPLPQWISLHMRRRLGRCGTLPPSRSQ